MTHLEIMRRHGILRRAVMPILESRGLYLCGAGGDALRFIKAFGRAWSRLPPRASRELLQYWRDGAPQQGVLRPVIELLPRRATGRCRRRSGPGPTAAGTACSSGLI
jgi:hypothetical protein